MPGGWRGLLAAALTGLDAGGEVTLRRLAAGHGALVSDLDDHEVLIRLQPGLEHAAPAPLKGDIPSLH